MTNYTKVPSIGQIYDNSCWAACLAWWLKAVQGGRPSWTQSRVMQEFKRCTDTNGAMSADSMINGLTDDTRMKMSAAEFETPDEILTGLPLGSKPVVIAFKHITGFAHMNVIWACRTGTVMCMEPFWPMPGVDNKRTGRFVERGFDHFNYGNSVVMAWGNLSDGSSTSSPMEAG
ncbi:hypothetical protein ACQW02_11225 [Humitalea sp. 24SJ18S-53]|uniref:hypothetical protein n=1 Tax=Humitalea sp. 24SJ18S-53 TaxID=3422307 RepID=UPI003D66DFD4